PGGSGANYLSAVKAVAANDVWAVGYFSDPQAGGVRALFLHWNGAIWSVVQGQDPVGAGRRLYGIDAIASNDAWAGGDYEGHSAMFHWNGSAWSDVAVPDIGQINSISAATASEV